MHAEFRRELAPGLVEVLQWLPEEEIRSMARRIGLEFHPHKRITPRTQLARALVSLPQVRNPDLLPAATRELLWRVAEAGGVLRMSRLPRAAWPLLKSGVLYARSPDEGDDAVELHLPAALLIQLPAWESEDPRGVRRLLIRADESVGMVVASYYQGLNATRPLSIALEPAWRALNDPKEIRRQLLQLAPVERRLLVAIEAAGGEVDTEELMELERDPMRLRTTQNSAQSRSGVGFALERRGFLIPIRPNRHVMPTEVVEVVGQERRQRSAKRVQALRDSVLSTDHLPRRADYALDPVSVVLAILQTVTDQGVEVRASLGTPRTVIHRLATRLGVPRGTVKLLCALSRAAGMWEPEALHCEAPPGWLPLQGVGQILFDNWLAGGVWDEARGDPELLRVAQDARDVSPVRVIRDVVLEVLLELGQERWLAWPALLGLVQADARVPGLTRLFGRWARRAGVEMPDLQVVVRRVTFDSLFGLGVLDLGDGVDEGPSVRLTPRGERCLRRSGAPGLSVPPPSTESPTAMRAEFSGQKLVLGPAVLLAEALSLVPFVEAGSVLSGPSFEVTAAGVARAVCEGMTGEDIRERLERVANIPEAIQRAVQQASAVIGRAEYAPASGFLWLDDPALRELLRSRRKTQELFVEPSPPGGLLVQHGVTLERVARRCRSLGIELYQDGARVRLRGASPGETSAAISVGTERTASDVGRRGGRRLASRRGRKGRAEGE